MKIYVRGQGAVSLNKRHFVAKGGEGDIYVRGDVAYKLFHDPKRAIAPSKVRELSAITDDRVIKPDALVQRSARGATIGYAMPFVRDTEPLCRLFPRSFKERNGLDAPIIHRLIEDLAARVRSVHAAGALIVDLNEMNFLVQLRSEAVFAIDADSYQTPSHPATAIMPSIQDPHTLGGGEVFSERSDWFSFAVLSFQLLIGVHPFKGKHPDVKGLMARMQQAISVFDAKVKLPRVAYPLDIIPDDWKGWYRAVFDEQKRLPPPADMTGGACYRVSARMPSAAALTTKELAAFPGAIRALLSLQTSADGFCVATAEGVYAGTRRIGDALPSGAVLGASAKGAAVAAWCRDERLELSDLTHGIRLETALAADDVFSVRGRILLKHDDKIQELILHDLGSTVVASSRWVARVLPHATQIFDGVALQSLLGARYASLFPAEGMHVQVRLPELDDLTVVDARADGDLRHGILLMAIARDRNGDDLRLVFRIAPDGARYDVDRRTLDSPMAAVCAVLDTGVAVALRADGKLEVFSMVLKRRSRRVIDADLSTGVHLSDHHGQLVGTRGDRVYLLTSHGEKTRKEDREAHHQT